MRRMLVLGWCLAFVTLGCGSSDDSADASGGSAGAGAVSGSGGSGGVGATGGSGGSAQGGSAGSGTGGSAGSGTGGSSGSGGTASPAVRFIGRPDTRESGVVRLAWSGSGIAFRFSGTDASVRLDDPAKAFTVVVDGKQQADLATTSGEQSYPVATGLAPGEHEVFLYRRTEAFFGVTRFLGVELGSGSLLAPPPAPARKLEVIGDSITCGYGNEGADQYCNFSAATENHYLTYGAIAARNVGAELSTVAWSGKGMIYNYGNDKTDPLPSLYDRALPNDATSSWDFSFQPDVVVINLGTNDFSTDGDPSESEFVGAYQSFLTHLRDVYPNAYLLCLVPTLLSGSDLTTAQSYIEKAVQARKSAGDGNLEAWAMTFTQTGWGCDWHPSLETHASMGAALTTKLKALKGW